MLNIYIFFFSLIIVSRFLFIFIFPETGGDYEIYATVAQNIIKGCGVSLSDPMTSDCIPHFGGNHGPGYDFFLALNWLLFKHSDFVVRINQTIIYAIFALYFLRNISQLIKNKYVLIGIGILLSLSPLTIAWPRYVQTETLSLAFNLFLFAELILSYATKKIRVIQIAIALILATWIRLDNVFLCFPVAVSCFYLHGPKQGLVKGIIIALIFSSTWGLWTLRNVNKNLPSLLPQDMIMPDGSRPPSGYLNWTKTWITHEYEKPGSLWGVNRKNYLNIKIPDYAFFDNEEKEIVDQLIKKLKKVNGQDFPENIDNKFQELALIKRSAYPLNYWIINPLYRTLRMWSNPFSSFGWPNEIPSEGLSHQDRLSAAKGNFDLLIRKALKYPYHTASKSLNAGYRFLLSITFLISISLIIKNYRKSFLSYFLILTLVLIVSRTLFFSINANFETRYLLTIIPLMEVMSLLTISNYFYLRKK